MIRRGQFQTATRARLLLAGHLIAAGTSGCGDPEVCDGSPAQRRLEITSGVAWSAFLGPSDAYAGAIVRVSGDSSAPSLCTGVFVDDDWLLTSSHCALSAIELVGPEGVARKLTPSESFPHPSLDVALVRVAAADASDASWVGLAREISTDWVGMPAQLAGFGVTEQGAPSDSLMLVVEPIVELRENELVVDGLGRSGACAGDSGGPLLARGLSGRIEVVGILAGGSAGCYGRDRYVRADRLAGWLDEIAGPPAEPSSGCAGLSEEGVCRLGRAMYCRGDDLVVDACSLDHRCGFNATEQGYRCVRPAEDTCHGVDDLGSCAASGASRCERGHLLTDACGCTEQCARSSESGIAACSPG